MKNLIRVFLLQNNYISTSPLLKFKNYQFNIFIFFLGVFALPLAGLSQSQPKSNPLAKTEEFTLFTKSDVTLISNENEGPAAIGGNLYLGNLSSNQHTNYSVYSGKFRVPNTNIPLALLVNGGINYYKGTLKVIGNEKGLVKIGQLSAGGNVHQSTVHETDRNGARSMIRITKTGEGYDNYNATIELSGTANDFNLSQNPIGFMPNSIIDFNQVFDELTKLSVDLLELTGTVHNVGGQNGRLNLINQSSNAAGDPYIWNTTAEDLSKLNELNISFVPSAERPLIINVTSGNSIDFRVFNMNGFNVSILPYVLWNFPDVVDFNITSGNTIEGSILAPKANLRKTGANNIQGQVVVNTFYQTTGELHNFPFRGKILIPDDEDNPPMPVTLTDFRVIKENFGNQLIWNTADEVNSSHFEVERSVDNVNWHTLGKVQAKGNYEKPSYYSYNDLNPELKGSNIYYRLKMVDLDHTYDYSRSVSIKNEFDLSTKILVYPNPVAESLYFDNNGTERIVSVAVFNLNGMPVIEGNLQNNSLDVKQLKSGLHIVRITFESGAVVSNKVLVRK